MANICHVSFPHLSYLPDAIIFFSEVVFCSMISVISLPGATLNLQEASEPVIVELDQGP